MQNCQDCTYPAARLEYSSIHANHYLVVVGSLIDRIQKQFVSLLPQSFLVVGLWCRCCYFSRPTHISNLRYPPQSIQHTFARCHLVFCTLQSPTWPKPSRLLLPGFSFRICSSWRLLSPSSVPADFLGLTWIESQSLHFATEIVFFPNNFTLLFLTRLRYSRLESIWRRFHIMSPTISAISLNMNPLLG